LAALNGWHVEKHFSSKQIDLLRMHLIAFGNGSRGKSAVRRRNHPPAK